LCVSGTDTKEPFDFSTIAGSPPNESTELVTAFERCLSGETVVVESRFRLVAVPDEGQWKLHFFPFVVVNERGVLILFEDITEQRIATDAFEAAEQRFRSLVDAAGDGIVIYRSRILLYVNPEAVGLFGYKSPDELVGRPLGDLVEFEHRASFEANLSEVESSLGVGVFETTFVRCDGVSFSAECRTSQTRIDDTGAGFLFVRNTATRKRQQARRENAKRIESLARLSSAIGAELRSYANRLHRVTSQLAGYNDERQSRVLELLQITNELSERSSQLLLPETTTSRGTDLIPLEVLLERVCSRLTRCLSETTSDQANTVRAQANDVHIDLEPVEYAVRGDPIAIEQGLVTLALAVRRPRTQRTPLRVIGVKSGKLERDTRLGYRLTISSGEPQGRSSNYGAIPSDFTATTSPFGSWEKGHDLELLEAFAVLLAQGCWVETQQGARDGLYFEVELVLDPTRPITLDTIPPVPSQQFFSSPALTTLSTQTPHLLEPEESSPETARSFASQIQPYNRAQSPILICDDEPRLVALTAGLLKEFGFEVLTVRSGAEAIKVLQTNPADVVILDVNLPGEDARDIVVELRRKSPVSVILSSGYTEEDVDPLLLQEPTVRAFLSKPYSVDVLVQTIDRVRAESSLRQKSSSHI
jgi:PAS domain S-box-containing protein